MVNSKAAASFIIRNETGDPIVAGARSLGESSICVAECLALRDAFWLARRSFKKVCVEGDSKLVIDAITGSCIVPWRLIDDIKDIAKYFEYIFWTRVKRTEFFVRCNYQGWISLYI